jgi:curli biogenesis system outer membrane secretion channel CsgG
MKLGYLLILGVLSACSTTIGNFDGYQKQFLSKSKFMPSKETLEGKSSKIVVFPLEHNQNQLAVETNLGESLANNIENVIGKNRLGEIVDRKAALKLQEEIKLSEMNKTGSYKGPIVADYAVSGAISNAGFTSKYSSGSTYYNPQSKQFVSIPPKYTYSSDVAGNIKIYELPSLSVVESIEFSAKKSRSESVQQEGGLSLGGIQIGGKKAEGADRDDNLIRKAAEEAVADAEIDIKNFFARKGYILEKRVLDNKSIFKISLGSSDGIKQNDKFEVVGQFESENPITNEIEIERKIIAVGTVSDLIDPKSSWVVIDDAKKTEAIRLGDSVKLKYKKNSFAKFFKLLTSFME